MTVPWNEFPRVVVWFDRIHGTPITLDIPSTPKERYSRHGKVVGYKGDDNGSFLYAVEFDDGGGRWVYLDQIVKEK